MSDCAKLVALQIVPFLGTHSHWKPVVWSSHRTGSDAGLSLLQVHPTAPTPAMGVYNELMITAHGGLCEACTMALQHQQREDRSVADDNLVNNVVVG